MLTELQEQDSSVLRLQGLEKQNKCQYFKETMDMAGMTSVNMMAQATVSVGRI